MNCPPTRTSPSISPLRLAKLGAMRDAADALLTGPVLKRDVFGRGDSRQEATIVSSSRIAGDLYELMEAYVSQAQARRESAASSPAPPQAYPPWKTTASERLRGMLPEPATMDLATTGVAPMAAAADGPSQASFIASTLSATLEFVREGDLEARQLEHFGNPSAARSKSLSPLRGGG